MGTASGCLNSNFCVGVDKLCEEVQQEAVVADDEDEDDEVVPFFVVMTGVMA
jgi:hypothetical protein